MLRSSGMGAIVRPSTSMASGSSVKTEDGTGAETLRGVVAWRTNGIDGAEGLIGLDIGDDEVRRRATVAARAAGIEPRREAELSGRGSSSTVTAGGDSAVLYGASGMFEDSGETVASDWQVSKVVVDALEGDSHMEMSGGISDNGVSYTDDMDIIDGAGDSRGAVERRSDEYESWRSSGNVLLRLTDPNLSSIVSSISSRASDASATTELTAALTLEATEANIDAAGSAADPRTGDKARDSAVGLVI